MKKRTVKRVSRTAEEGGVGRSYHRVVSPSLGLDESTGDQDDAKERDRA